ncbi:ras-related protein Rab-39B [Herpailurus yagouaroundi]|uniref:ras-related protein Rab-39B n=1 Tax=Herpailurus yagouaroundi TaxID=1608482 RepID=UPI001AD64B2B|nr:ras-related protein Rab-39B [Puma yagouaroundi]
MIPQIFLGPADACLQSLGIGSSMALRTFLGTSWHPSAVSGHWQQHGIKNVPGVRTGVWARPLFFTSFLCSRSITRAYYRNSVGGLLLFDITNRRSFQNVHEWLEETKVHVQPYQIVFVLVGHKCDLDTQRQVTRHEAEKLAAAYGMKYIETSARDAINVEKAFTDLTRDIYELVKRGDITIQEGWEGVKSGFVPNVVHSSEEVVKSERRCLC